MCSPKCTNNWWQPGKTGPNTLINGRGTLNETKRNLDRAPSRFRQRTRHPNRHRAAHRVLPVRKSIRRHHRCARHAGRRTVEGAGKRPATRAGGGMSAPHDPVNHPRHYTSHPSGIECIQITEHMSFNLGNVIKYCWRADEKGAPLHDLKKARWYLDREIAKRETAAAKVVTILDND